MIDYKKLSHEYRDLYRALTNVGGRGDIKYVILTDTIAYARYYYLDKLNKNMKGRSSSLVEYMRQILEDMPENKVYRDIITSMIDHIGNEDYLLAANVGTSLFEKNPLENYKDKDIDDFIELMGVRVKKSSNF